MHPTSGYAVTWRHRVHDGYWERRWWVGSRPDRKQCSQREHRWVWELHNGPIPPGHHVHHVDENIENNAIENLELLTEAEHLGRHGRHSRQRVTEHGREQQCSRCESWLPREAFSRRGRRDNRHAWCRSCQRDYARAKYVPRGPSARALQKERDWNAGLLRCSRCKIARPFADFCSTTVAKRGGYCRDCAREYQRKRAA